MLSIHGLEWFLFYKWANMITFYYYILSSGQINRSMYLTSWTKVQNEINQNVDVYNWSVVFLAFHFPHSLGTFTVSLNWQFRTCSDSSSNLPKKPKRDGSRGDYFIHSKIQISKAIKFNTKMIIPDNSVNFFYCCTKIKQNEKPSVIFNNWKKKNKKWKRAHKQGTCPQHKPKSSLQLIMLRLCCNCWCFHSWLLKM